MNLRNTILSALVFAAMTAFAAVPEYVKVNANKIESNGADWTALRSKVAKTMKGDTTDIRILHIGDSHIQAEFVTNHLRGLLQKRYGNAGRGLITPLRLAGTNQPHDYAVTAQGGGDWAQTRLLKYPWPVKPGMTGISARPSEAATVIWKPLLDGHKIKHAAFLTSEGLKTAEYPTLQDSVTLSVAPGTSIYGAILDNGKKGLLYSAIGNNGACFNDYSLIDNFANRTHVFNPDLIILSMGTNEGFSTMTDEQIARSVDDLVTTLRDYNPDAAMLILLPMECQKNRNHGHKPLSPYYDINKRVAEAKDIINARAKALGVPVWDFYTIAGGHGASDKWLADKLMNKDRIHLLKPGYELMGELLYDALVPALEN